MSKFLRDLKRIAGEEGYVYEGFDGSDHHVFTDTKSGAVVRTSATPKNPGNALKNVRANFQNARRGQKTAAAAFRRWMLKRYKVGKGGSKVVEVTVRDLAAEFNASHDVQITNSHITVLFNQDPMFERIDKVGGGKGTGRGHTITTLRISGPAYGLTKEPEVEVSMDLVCGATFQTPQKGIAVCVLATGHSGLHWDSYRNVRWAEGSGVKEREVEPVIDPVAAEAIHALPKLADQVTQTPGMPVLEPVTVGGLTLSDELADQLREALGVPNAAIAAENQDAALAALTDAAHQLQKAMDAIRGLATMRQPYSGKAGHHEGGKIGPKRRERLNKIVAAVKRGELEERFTTEDVKSLFGWSEGTVVSMLARAHATGDTVRRVERSTYEVR